MDDPKTPEEEEKAKAAYAGGETGQTESAEPTVTPQPTPQIISTAVEEKTNGHTGPKPATP